MQGSIYRSNNHVPPPPSKMIFPPPLSHDAQIFTLQHPFGLYFCHLCIYFTLLTSISPFLLSHFPWYTNIYSSAPFLDLFLPPLYLFYPFNFNFPFSSVFSPFFLHIFLFFSSPSHIFPPNYKLIFPLRGGGGYFSIYAPLVGWKFALTILGSSDRQC